MLLPLELVTFFSSILEETSINKFGMYVSSYLETMWQQVWKLNS